jgi:hypothetical protein
MVAEIQYEWHASLPLRGHWTRAAILFRYYRYISQWRHARSFEGEYTLWRQLFPAIQPMFQRNQRRYHIKKTRYNKRIFYSEERNTIKKYIKHTLETVSGPAFIWSINLCHNSSDTERWQRVTRMAKFSSNTNTNNISNSKQIHLQTINGGWKTLQISKHGQNTNKEKTDKLWRKTILLRFLLITENVINKSYIRRIRKC